MAEIKIGSKVTDDPELPHRGQVLEIRYNKGKHEFEAYVYWHKGYSSWMLFHRLTLKD